MAEILIVDENEDFREVIRAMCQDIYAEIDFTLASDGREAVRAILEKNFDLAIVNCQAREIDGMDLYRILQEREGCAIILTTSYDWSLLPFSIIQKLRRYGVDQRIFLRKPFGLREFSQVFDIALDLRDAWKPLKANWMG